MNLKEVEERIPAQDLQPKLVTVFGNPVWDYKCVNNTVHLIYEPTEGIAQEDLVTIGELIDFCKDIWESTEDIIFVSETTGEPLSQVEILGEGTYLIEL